MLHVTTIPDHPVTLNYVLILNYVLTTTSLTLYPPTI